MYESYYGFREKPFHVTADPAYLFPSRCHQEALNHLLYGVRERLGFGMITGEVGTGKTTLAKALLERLQPPIQTALILNPTFSPLQLLRVVVRDFGLEAEPGRRSTGSGRGALLETLERFLLGSAKAGGMGVIILDEAQGLSASALEQIRLLSNIETPKRKLITVILIGQTELEDRLRRDARLKALRERIAVRYCLSALDERQVAEYISHRLRVAGGPGPTLFAPEAIREIARRSQGIPRRINLLCDQALLAGFVRQVGTIDRAVLEWALGAEVKTDESGRRLHEFDHRSA